MFTFCCSGGTQAPSATTILLTVLPCCHFTQLIQGHPASKSCRRKTRVVHRDVRWYSNPCLGQFGSSCSPVPLALWGQSIYHKNHRSSVLTPLYCYRRQGNADPSGAYLGSDCRR